MFTIKVIWHVLDARIQLLRRSGDRGEITSTVLVIAMLAVLAIAVMGVIAAKLIAKANSIDLGLA
ncbi:hypothetical protein F4560_001064 [Saccharothrix ecbatanensis]|uniref:Uncharacterized protein n=1 Tax=Saccharothrix ecbatanensis TaxID=1105145 RepID=A0A7W9LYZ8_9PSEU|nr:hypothetical protein [Saccharothrix ecbatanensis]MBB5801296.1 hypothetical protein [Saccharothrix ecbatanensis]